MSTKLTVPLYNKKSGVISDLDANRDRHPKLVRRNKWVGNPLVDGCAQVQGYKGISKFACSCSFSYNKSNDTFHKKRYRIDEFLRN